MKKNSIEKNKCQIKQNKALHSRTASGIHASVPCFSDAGGLLASDNHDWIDPNLLLVSSCGYALAVSRFPCFVWNLLLSIKVVYANLNNILIRYKRVKIWYLYMTLKDVLQSLFKTFHYLHISIINTGNRK